MQHFGDFILAIWAGWFSFMSGGLSVPLAALAFFVSNKVGKAFLGGTAAICFVAASYAVWDTQREAKENAEKRVAQLENEYPYSLYLTNVQVVDERKRSPKVKTEIIGRRLQFLLLWNNTIGRAVEYQIQNVTIDKKPLAVLNRDSVAISPRSPSQFFIPFVDVDVPVSNSGFDVHTIDMQYRYGEPDRMTRCVQRSIRFEINFDTDGSSWVDPSKPKDAPCR